MFNCSEVTEDFVVDQSGTFLLSVAWVTFVAALVHFPVCFLFFYINRNTSERLRRRNHVLLVCFCMSLGFNALTISLRNIVGAANYPCDFHYLSGSLFAFCFGFLASTFRLLGLYFRISFNRKLLSNVFNLLQEGELLFKPGEATFRATKHIDENSVPITSVAGHQTVTLSSGMNSDESRKIVSRRTKTLQAVLFFLFCWQNSPHLVPTMQLSYFFASNRFINGCYLLTSVLVMTFAAFFHFREIPFGSNCLGCSLQGGLETNLPAILLSAFFITFSIFKLRKYEDALGIKQELFVVGSSLVIFIMLVIFPATIFLDEVQQQGKWDWPMLTVFHLFFLGWFSFVYQVQKAKRKDREARSLKDVSVENILSTEQGTKAFALYLSVHLSIENLYFYKAVENWKSKFGSNSDAVNSDIARNIFVTYVEEDAMLLVNISYRTRDALIRKFNSNENVDENIFDRAFFETHEILSTSVFQQFLESKYYTLYQNKAEIHL